MNARTLRVLTPALVLLAFAPACKKRETPAPGAPGAPGASASKYKTPEELPAANARVTLVLGSGSGLSNPRGVAVTAAGEVLVVDAGNTRVVRFDANGRQLGTFGTRGAEPGQFLQPWAATIDPQGNLVVLDSETQFVDFFSADGRHRKRLFGPPSFYFPRGMALSKDGRIAVADTGTSHVVTFDSDGKPASEPVGGTDKAKLDQPTEVVWDAAGGLHVLQLADGTTGGLLRRVEADGTLKDEFLVSSVPSTADSGRGTVLPDGRWAFTDPLRQRVVVLTADGAKLTPLALTGDQLQPLQNPSAIAHDGKGRIFVSDAGTGLVYRIEVPAP